jgi:uncharacterized OsmC-like protein
MPQATIEVVASHLHGELVTVEFAHSRIVSDHPVRMGGSGKGPSPGELLLSGLLASTAITAQAAARRAGLPVSAVVARGVFRNDLLRIAGPLPAIAFLAQARRRIEFHGASSLQSNALVECIAGEPLARRLRSPAHLDETVSLRASTAPRGAVEEASAGTLGMVRAAEAIPTGERKAGMSEASWRISATSLGDAALVQLSNQVLMAGGTHDGPSPTELLLAGLAACTAIYVGRNAVLNKIPLENVTVRVRAPASLERIEKATEIRGNLRPGELEILKYCADHCALGETLLRGMAIADDIAIVELGSGRESVDPRAALAVAAPPPAAGDCDDGSCCIAEPVRVGASARA